MTLKNKRLAPKITELFDILENNIESGDYERAEITLARLSTYFHLFDDEHIDYYHYARDTVDSFFDEAAEETDDEFWDIVQNFTEDEWPE